MLCELCTNLPHILQTVGNSTFEIQGAFRLGICVKYFFSFPQKNLSPEKTETTMQTHSLYRLQGSPCVVILPCKDPVKITGYHSNPSSYVVGT